MKRLYMMAAAVPLLSLVAAAQDVPRRVVNRQEIDDAMQQAQQKVKAEMDAVMGQMKVVSLSGAAMGPTVKGAPYSAVEVSENNQVLADGTRIHNENQTTVYRDGEGRVRRETPNQITIMDPVAGVSFFLNPKTQTATKATLSMPALFRRSVGVGGGGGFGARLSVVDSCARILLGEPKNSVEPFRVSQDSTEQKTRNDGACALRTHLTKDGPGYRLMLWELKDKSIEFANVGPKNELVIR